jgi:hypothetical protein
MFTRCMQNKRVSSIKFVVFIVILHCSQGSVCMPASHRYAYRTTCLDRRLYPSRLTTDVPLSVDSLACAIGVAADFSSLQDHLGGGVPLDHPHPLSYVVPAWSVKMDRQPKRRRRRARSDPERT